MALPWLLAPESRTGWAVGLAIHKAYTKYADMLVFQEHGTSLYEFALKAGTDAKAAEQLADIEERTKKAKGGLQGTALVSDGFFPFRDGVDVAVRERVQAIAQPRGAMLDAEIIEACNETVPQVAMGFTGQRSFKH